MPANFLRGELDFLLRTIQVYRINQHDLRAGLTAFSAHLESKSKKTKARADIEQRIKLWTTADTAMSRYIESAEAVAKLAKKGDVWGAVNAAYDLGKAFGSEVVLDRVRVTNAKARSEAAKHDRPKNRKFTDRQLREVLAPFSELAVSRQAVLASNGLGVTPKAIEERMKRIGLWKPNRGATASNRTQRR